jgi:hypothetical protein
MTRIKILSDRQTMEMARRHSGPHSTTGNSIVNQEAAQMITLHEIEYAIEQMFLKYQRRGLVRRVRRHGETTYVFTRLFRRRLAEWRSRKGPDFGACGFHLQDDWPTRQKIAHESRTAILKIKTDDMSAAGRRTGR